MAALIDLYFFSINPYTKYSELFSSIMLLSIFLHSISYLFMAILVNYIFNLKLENSTFIKLYTTLLIIMTFGYYCRLWRSKSIYKYLIKIGYTDNQALVKTMSLMNRGYFTYYFIG